MYYGNKQIKKDVDNYFSRYNYKIIDIEKCIEHLIKNNYVWCYEDIITRWCENNEIKCPIECLNQEKIMSIISEEYVKIGEEYICDIDFKGFNGFRYLLNEKIIERC